VGGIGLCVVVKAEELLPVVAGDREGAEVKEEEDLPLFVGRLEVPLSAVC